MAIWVLLPVVLTRDAIRDLDELVEFIERHDSPGRAKHVAAKIQAVVLGLADQPHRGAHPPELAELGIREFWEVFFKPYRIVYRVLDDRVVVLLIADGRRDMLALLQRRLLAG